MTEDDEEGIEIALDCTYSAWVAWARVIVAPVAVVGVAVMFLLGRKSDFEQYPEETRKKLSRFTLLASISDMANSPLAAVIFLLELLIVVVLFIPLDRLAYEMDLALDKPQPCLTT